MSARRPGPGVVLRAAALLLLLLLLLTACAATLRPTAEGPANAAQEAQSSASAGASGAADSREDTTVLATLGSLPVEPRPSMADYDRDDFGADWLDLDGDGCNTRDELLGRRLRRPTYEPGTRRCVVTTGLLRDPYTGTKIRYSRGGAVDVDVDHVVSLGDAWSTGADRWTAGKRVAFANDPLNLLPVAAGANRQKGDADAAEWLPPARAYRCRYVARQVAVKAAYGLAVTPAERSVMERVLRRCPDQVLPGRPRTTTGPPPDAGQASGPTSGIPRRPAYKDCTAAAAAGVTPLHRGDPGYAPRLDGDGDGTACE